MSTECATPNDLLKLQPDQVLGTSDWILITQERINQFADATGDHQWIHVDEARAKDGPFGKCIAHGFLTLSLINCALPNIIQVREFSNGINYGCNKVRFPAPVPVGSEINMTGTLVSVEQCKDNAVQIVVRIHVAVKGQDRPACVADTISRYYA